MRKKSHISMANQIIDALEIDSLYKHKMAFRIGNVLPDCRPSFITMRHSYDTTIQMTEERMQRFMTEYRTLDEITGRVCMELGEIIHFIADYFTFPHNSHYTGTMKDHCYYEKDLKFKMREFAKSDEIQTLYKKIKRYDTLEELIAFLKKAHAWYMRVERNIADDCKFAFYVCASVVATIFHIIEEGMQPAPVWKYQMSSV